MGAEGSRGFPDPITVLTPSKQQESSRRFRPGVPKFGSNQAVAWLAALSSAGRFWRSQTGSCKQMGRSMSDHDLVATWEEHLGQEFAVRNPDAPTHTMGVDPEVDHVHNDRRRGPRRTEAVL